LELPMDGTRGQKDVDAGFLGALERLPGPIDVLVVATRQSADGGAAHLVGNLPDCLKVARRSNRKAGLDDVYTQLNQSLGNLQLFCNVHAGARRLFAVAQRGVEDTNVSW